jgi:hypothetical protein
MEAFEIIDREFDKVQAEKERQERAKSKGRR